MHYLNIKPDYSEAEIEKLNNQKLTVADYTGWTLEDAKTSLGIQGLKSNIGAFFGEAPVEEDLNLHDDDDVGDGTVLPDNSYLVNYLNGDLQVVDQYPKPGMKIAPGGIVFLYWE